LPSGRSAIRARYVGNSQSRPSCAPRARAAVSRRLASSVSGGSRSSEGLRNEFNGSPEPSLSRLRTLCFEGFQARRHSPACASKERAWQNEWAHRAPRDEASASDAAAPELVVPMSELVRKPLTIARGILTPNAAAMNVTELQREAAVPTPLTADVIAGESAHVFDRTAAAGRTDVRAIRTVQTTRGDLGPAMMLEVGL
jgi:hypothetical protein